MRIRSIKAKRVALQRSAAAALGLAVCGSAWSLSLGRVVLQSGRGEPLHAEVELEDLSPEEAASVSAGIAGADTYSRSGVNLSAALAQARVSVARRPDGHSVLRISSPQPVQEAFLDLILEVKWSSGALVREYTLLLDAPRAPAEAQAPAAAPLLGAMPAPVPAPAPVAPAEPAAPSTAAAPPPAPPPAAPPPKAARETRQASEDQAEGPSERYTVRRGDTLASVAGRLARPGVSLDQMLVALYRGNPQAFINNNMNLLRANAVLRLPTAEEAAQLARGEARQLVRMQSADFQAYRARLAQSAPAARVEESARRSGGAVEAAVEDRQTAPATPDRLRLSRTPGSEAALSREVERRDQAQRVAELSRNVEELRRLAATPPGGVNAPAAAEAASASKMAAVPPSASAPNGPAASPSASAPNGLAVSPSVNPVAGAASAIDAGVAAANPASVAEALDAASAVAGAASVPDAMAAASSASAVAEAESLPPQPEPPRGLNVQSRNWWLALAGALVLLVGGGAALLKLRKRRKAAAETSFLESRLQPDSFFGASGGQQVDTGEAAATPSAADQYSLSQLDANGDVDPVAEADVYLAYGRDLQAEEILKEALRSNPQRLAIRTKLLEVYAKRQDAKAFEAQAQQLQQITQGEGEDWIRVRDLGRQIDPSNPLYGLTSAPPGREPDTLAPSSWPTDVEAVAPRAPAGRLDLDLGQLGKPPAPAPQPTRPASKAERPATAFAPVPDAGPVTRVPHPDPSETVPPLDFGPTKPPRVSVPSEGAPALPFDLDSLSLDLDEPSSSSVLNELKLSGFDEAADPLQRKLDLAEEFRQIGENEAARDLLQEVVAQASGDVKARAESMLASLV